MVKVRRQRACKHLSQTESIASHADPFETLLLPQHIEEELTEGVARVVAFHPSGNLLAGVMTRLLKLQMPKPCSILQHCTAAAASLGPALPC